MTRIQLLDDEPQILKALQRVIRREGWEADAFTDAEEALAALGETEYAVIVVDFQMPQINGVTYLQFARQSQPDAARMVLTGHSDGQTMMKAINLAEVYRFLSKPWDDCELVGALRSGIDLYRLRADNRRLLEQVRQQQSQLDRQGRELSRLEQENPGITQVERDEQGNVVVGDFDGL